MFSRMQERAAVIRETKSKTNRTRFAMFLTGVGTHHCHSWNQKESAQAQSLIVLRVQERGTVIRETKSEPPTAQARFQTFYGCKNVPLSFAERFICCPSVWPAAGEIFWQFRVAETHFSIENEVFQQQNRGKMSKNFGLRPMIFELTRKPPLVSDPGQTRGAFL